MGYTFAAALVKKTGTAPQTRKAIREGLENLGCRKASNAEDASLVLPLHHDKKSAWMTSALEMPESIGRQMELLCKLAAEMHTAILYFMNFDSDFLYIGATDGKAVQHVHVGFIDEEDEAMTDSDDLSVFDALLPDEVARAEFRRILAVDDEERVFSEEAAQEMAALFGYTPEALFIDEDAEPFAVLAFDLPGQEDVPFLMPEDAPPAFAKGPSSCSGSNPIEIFLPPSGGAGRGIRVTVVAENYDVDDWELLPLYLTNEDCAEEGVYTAAAVPSRVSFPDGREGWIAEFPDVPLRCGVNPASPQRDSLEAEDIYIPNGYALHLAFRGGHPAPQRMDMTPPSELRDDPAGTRAWLKVRFEQIMNQAKAAPRTMIQASPIENPKGGIAHRVNQTQLSEAPFWLTNDDE